MKPGLAGIRSYVLGVVGALARRSDIELSVVTSEPASFGDMGEAEIIPIPAWVRSFGGRALWREAALGRMAARTRADLVFVPFPELAARPLPVPSVVVVFDVGPLVAPALFTRAKRARFALDQARVCRAATRVVCVSNATLIALHGAVGVDPAKCEVIGAAAQHRLPPASRSGDGADPYVLYVGTLLAHKNVPTLVKAFSGEPSRRPRRLLLAGPATAAEGRTLDALVATLGVADRVEHRGWVPAEELALLYASAWAVAVPSLHEGYGLPVLEAMAAGAPVVASDIPSIREVAGDAVAYVSRPLDPDGWRAALGRLSDDPVERASLARLGSEKALTYSWETVAEQLARLFRSTIDGRS
ncbi:MAG: glycosyltransferase family 4 protein [Acidimicrobiales bacterium]